MRFAAKENTTEKKFNLSLVPLFATLTKSDRELITSRSAEKYYGPNSSIIQFEDSSTAVYFIISGSAHVLNYSASGRAITYASMTEGDLFGEIAAIDGLPRSAWVYSMDECHILEIPGAIFKSLARGNQDFAFVLLEKLSKNLREMNDRLIQIFSLDVERRACIELMRMARPDPENPMIYRVNPMPTQMNFATLIGSSRETVSRVIGRLKEQRIVEYTTTGLCIIDRERLEQRAFDRLV